jgi:polygalacturonase
VIFGLVCGSALRSDDRDCLNILTGEYLTGRIHLKTNITFNLENKVIIKFTLDFDDYIPLVRMRREGTEFNNFSPLIYANGQQNIQIKGREILDGQGLSQKVKRRIS